MKILARTEAKKTHGYSIHLIIKLPVKNKRVCDVAKRKSFLSFLVMF